METTAHLDKRLHEVLEEAAPIHACLLDAVLIDELDADAAFQVLPKLVELVEAILQQAQHHQTVTDTDLLQ